MTIATIAYVPPPKVQCAPAFVRNVRSKKSKYPVILFADHREYQPEIITQSPELIGRGRYYYISNHTFLMALGIAEERSLDYFIYMEADSRVGCDLWDEVMVEDHFANGREPLMSGFPAIHHPLEMKHAGLARFCHYAWEFLNRSALPIAIHSSQVTGLYPNGSVAVYKTDVVRQLLGKGDPFSLAQQFGPWDLEIGVRLWSVFGLQVFDVVRGLGCIYSGCTDMLTTEPERLAMLKNGKVAVHQVKSNVDV